MSPRLAFSNLQRAAEAAGAIQRRAGRPLVVPGMKIEIVAYAGVSVIPGHAT